MDQLATHLTYPETRLYCISIVVGCIVVAVLSSLFHYTARKKGRNPFKIDARVVKRPFVADKEKRDEVLKVGYSKKKIGDTKYDAVIIGSGVGGLVSAAILARANKKVLLVEQHDQVGGCCHVFNEHGYSFDTGIHYIG